MLFLGIDIGSSSVKTCIFDASSGMIADSAIFPPAEMEILSPAPGFAEQNPDSWYNNIKEALKIISTRNANLIREIEAIGIAYQMHGLVIVDKDGKPLRNAIIWCDSRAVETGAKAFDELGRQFCLSHLLNSPGNFTASKLKWVKDNEPDMYSRIHKIMLPGDYIAYRLTGEICTTETGLSEGIFWDFTRNSVSQELLENYGIDQELLASTKPVFSVQGYVTKTAAADLGLKPGIPVTYRSGDQPNNAFSLNVLNPGEVAATAGTSGVVYGVTDQMKFDPLSRINTFLHVNHKQQSPRLGQLLCINATGILNSWLKNNIASGKGYDEMNRLAASVPAGCDGLTIFPFGNGAERILDNKNPGAVIEGLNFNTHNINHLLRAAQESIVFSFVYGMEIMKKSGLNPALIKAGKANMFLSPLFGSMLANLSGANIHLYNTDGAQGAARGAAIGAGYFSDTKEAFSSLKILGKIQPEKDNKLQDHYNYWKTRLEQKLKEQ
jgi:xylulokinase